MKRLVWCLMVLGVSCAPSDAQKPQRVHARHDALSTGVVISEVYGGGTSATYTHDFVELLNKGAAPVDVTGWSVQYAGTTGSSWIATSLGNFGPLAPGQSLLIRMATTGGSTAVPAPDVIGGTNLSGTAGKVALVRSSTPLTGDCPSASAWVDFVGYGPGTNCSEGAPAPSGSATASMQRRLNGCQETDSNASDFVAATPNPRNSMAAAVTCSSGPVDAGCRQVATWPTVATEGGYDANAQTSYADLFTEEPGTATGGMEILSTEAYFGGGATVPASDSFVPGGLYNDCSLCAYIRTGCDAAGQCTKEFFAQAGSISVSAASASDTTGQFVGTLANVRFEEWDFDADQATGSGECVELTQAAVNVSWNRGDGGSTDAGQTDGGATDGGGTADGGMTPTTKRGCGCTTDGDLNWLWALGLLALWLRRSV